MAYALRDSFNKIVPIESQLQIGRDPVNRIVLLDPKVAPFHATLWEQTGILYLQDNTSGTATFVNQMPIQGIVALKVGDQVAIGSTPFLVENLNAPPLQTFVQPIAPPTAPFNSPTNPLKTKKRKGCGGWILTALLVFVSECVLIGVVGAILASTDVELKGGIQDLTTSNSSSSDNPPTDTSQAGPAILKLDEKWLTNTFTRSFTQHMVKKAEGISASGSPSSTILTSEFMQQSMPNWISYQFTNQTTNGSILFNIDRGITGETIYSNDNNSCSVTPDSTTFYYDDTTPLTILSSELTGHVKRVETGVTINGILTDKYELRQDNFTKTDIVLEFISGDLYRARDGGYLVQLDYVVKFKPQSLVINMGEDFSDTDPSTVTFHFDRTYSPDGTLSPKVPDVCVSQVQ
jgi:hypothetical protein